MLKWIGTVSGIIGALLVASNNGWQVLGYLCFLLGSLSWLYISVSEEDKAAILQWGFFSCVNAYGILAYHG